MGGLVLEMLIAMLSLLVETWTRDASIAYIKAVDV